MRHLCYILGGLALLLAPSCNTLHKARTAPPVVGNPFSTRPVPGAAKKADTATRPESPAQAVATTPTGETPGAGTPAAPEASPGATVQTQPAAGEQATVNVPAPRTPEPSAAQQQAARELLASQPEQPRRTPTAANNAPIPAPQAELVSTPGASAAVPTPAMQVQPVGTPEAIPGSIRMGGFGPAAEPNSENLPTPGPNAVDMRGLRSPKLPGALPMSVDGKINKKETR